MNYPKIDIYLLNRGRKTWSYHVSTTWAKTCKEAKERFLKVHYYLSSDQVKAKFAKKN